MTSVYKLCPTIGCIATGLVPDSRSQIQKARQECADFQHTYSYTVPPAFLAGRMADQNQVYTQHAYMRPMGVGAWPSPAAFSLPFALSPGPVGSRLALARRI